MIAFNTPNISCRNNILKRKIENVVSIVYSFYRKIVCEAKITIRFRPVQEDNWHTTKITMCLPRQKAKTIFDSTTIV